MPWAAILCPISAPQEPPLPNPSSAGGSVEGEGAAGQDVLGADVVLGGRNALWEDSGAYKIRQIPAESAAGTGAAGPIVSALPAPLPSTPGPRLRVLHLAPKAALVESRLLGRGRAGDRAAAPQRPLCPGCLGAEALAVLCYRLPQPLGLIRRLQLGRCRGLEAQHPPSLMESTAWAEILGPGAFPAPQGTPDQGLWAPCRRPEAAVGQGPVQLARSPVCRAAGLSWHGPRRCLRELLSLPCSPC